MTNDERRALAEGMAFTGIYGRDYERKEVKARAAEIRKKGYRARMINLSDGISVYAEQKYFTDRRIEHLKKVLAAFNSKIEYARKRYEEGLQEITNEHENALREIERLEKQ